MVTINDIEAKTMSPEKRQEAKKDLFAFMWDDQSLIY